MAAACGAPCCRGAGPPGLEQNSRYVQIGLFVVLMLGLLDGPLSWLQLVFGTGVGALFGEPHMFSFSALFS